MTNTDYIWLAAMLQMAGATTKNLVHKIFQPYFLKNFEGGVFLIARGDLSELESALERAHISMSLVNSDSAVQKMKKIMEILQQVKRAILVVDARNEKQKVD